MKGKQLNKTKITQTAKLISLVCCMLFLAACSQSDPIATESGQILTFSTSNAPDGYYVKKGDDIHPVLSAGLNNRKPKVHMYTDYDQLIPSLNSGDELIMVQSTGNLPTSFFLTRMQDIGWTVGTNFTVQQTTSINTQNNTDNNPDDRADYSQSNINFGEIQNTLSPIAQYITENVTNKRNTYITDVNGQPLTQGMLTEQGFLKGLTKRAMYKFSYYEGTKYNSIDFMADTRVFTELTEIPITEYKRMKDTYFSLTLPEGLTNGFYLVNDYGLFFYNGSTFEGE